MPALDDVLVTFTPREENRSYGGTRITVYGPSEVNFWLTLGGRRASLRPLSACCHRPWVRRNDFQQCPRCHRSYEPLPCSSAVLTDRRRAITLIDRTLQDGAYPILESLLIREDLLTRFDEFVIEAENVFPSPRRKTKISEEQKQCFECLTQRYSGVLYEC